MNSLQPWFGPVAAARPYFFRHCFLLLVAVDIVVLMVPRGSRYGIDGFSVAHFSWLDAIQPLPSPAWYVGVMTLAALLAVHLLLTGPSRWKQGILAALYTYGWAMSRLDSFMHHYMTSLILLAMVFFPKVSASNLYQWQLMQRSPPRNATSPRAAEAFTRKGWWFAGTILAVGIAYRLSDALRPLWGAFFAYAALVAGMFWWRSRQGVPLGPYVSAWAFRMLGATVGVIYFYTSLAKCDVEWIAGHTLQSVGDAARVLQPFEAAAAWLGIPRQWFWSLLASAVIPLELTLSASYVLAIFQDEPGRRWTKTWCPVAWLLAIALHMNNEFMGLSIQWFGFYMMFLACFFLLPERIVANLATASIWPAHFASVYLQTSETSRKSPPPRRASRLLGGTIILAAGLPLVLLLAWSVLIPGVALAGLAFLVLVAATSTVDENARGVVWDGPGNLGHRADPVKSPGPTDSAGFFRSARSAHTRRLPRKAYLGAAGPLALAWFLFCTSAAQFDFHEIRGRTLQLMGRHGEALKALQIAEAFVGRGSPRAAEFYVNLGLAYRQTGEYPTAISCYERALALRPTFFLAHYNWGNLLRDLGRRAEAIDHYRAALRQREDFSDAHVNLGLVLESLGQVDAAIEHYRLALAAEPFAEDIQSLLAGAESRRRGSELPAGSGGPRLPDGEELDGREPR